MYPLRYTELFKTSRSFTEVKQYLTRLYSDGGLCTSLECIWQLFILGMQFNLYPNSCYYVVKIK